MNLNNGTATYAKKSLKEYLKKYLNRHAKANRLALSMLFFSSVSMASIETGEQAPRIVATDVSGIAVDTAQYLGKKPVYVLFFEQYVPNGLDKALQLHERYKNEVEFISLTPAMNNTVGVTQWVKESHKINFPVIFDEYNAEFRQFQAWQQPTQILIDSKGKVQFYSQNDQADIEAAIKALLKKEKK